MSRFAVLFFLAAGTGINNSRPKQGQSREKDITYNSTLFHLESLSVRWQVCMNSISLDFPASFSVLKQQSSVVRGRFTKWRDDVWMCFENLCLVSNFPHRLFANCWTSIEYIFPLDFHSTSLLKSLLLYSQSCLRSSDSIYKFFQPPSSFIPKPY